MSQILIANGELGFEITMKTLGYTGNTLYSAKGIKGEKYIAIEFVLVEGEYINA